MNNWKALALVLGGIVVGMLLHTPESTTSASAPQYRQCIWYRGIGLAKNAEKVEKNATIIPGGWTPVGGGGPGRDALICR